MNKLILITLSILALSGCFFKIKQPINLVEAPTVENSVANSFNSIAIEPVDFAIEVGYTTDGRFIIGVTKDEYSNLLEYINNIELYLENSVALKEVLRDDQSL